jgi:NAD(P)-dependent dehydrogenase (short-subunit alcohol dehydrogenase family)
MTIVTGSVAKLGRIATALAQSAKHATPPPSLPPQPESELEGCISFAATASIASILGWLTTKPCAATLMLKSIAVTKAVKRRLKRNAMARNLPSAARPRKHKVVTGPRPALKARFAARLASLTRAREHYSAGAGSSMAIELSGKVAIVTGAGGGLGREHALALAARGAKVVVNDLGGARDGSGGSVSAAEKVVEEIVAAGGEGTANSASVTDYAAVETMVADAMKKWGRVDILVNNAGILRDKTFAKMEIADFRAVLDVHLMGAVHCTKAVWEIMRAQNYGRIVMTTSSSGLYGNFGQSNYGAAKMALVGLMQTLSLEGAKHNIRVNCLAPTAATRMTEGLLPAELLARMKPAAVSPVIVYLASEGAPTRAILCAGAGSFERAYITLTQGAFIGSGKDAADLLAARIETISSRKGDIVPDSAMDQGRIEITNAVKAG